MSDIDYDIDREWAAMNGVQERFEPVPEQQLSSLFSDPEPAPPSGRLVERGIEVPAVSPEVWLAMQADVAARLEPPHPSSTHWWRRGGKR